MDLYSKFKFNLKVTIATGLVGGLLFATYDITTTVLRNDPKETKNVRDQYPEIFGQLQEKFTE